MKILFIQPDFNYVKQYMSDYKGHSSLGIGYLSAVLKNNGFETALLHLNDENITKENFVNSVQLQEPDLVAYTAFTHQFEFVKQSSIWLKESGYTKPIICGGVHATIDPEDSINATGIDMICIGEGEDALLELCERIQSGQDYYDVNNLWIKKGNEIIKNPVRPLLQDLDKLPFLDKDIYDLRNIADGTMGLLSTIATRGCPFQCSYCCNHQYQRIYKGKGIYVRFRSPENVIEELEINKRKYPYLRYVELLDDTFLIKEEWVKEFCEKYKKRIAMPFRANAHVNFINENVLIFLKDAGCERLALGIESGNERIRQDVLNRNMTNDKILEAFRLCKKYEIEVISYNMVGIPFETLENTLETIKLNAQINPKSVHVAMCQPYPYTRLFDICRENNFIQDKTVSTFFGNSVINQPSISKEETLLAYKYFAPYVKIYSILMSLPLVGSVLIRFLDYIYCKKSLHNFLMKIYPVFLFISCPVLSTYRIMLSRFPHFTRNLKKKFWKRY